MVTVAVAVVVTIMGIMGTATKFVRAAADSPPLLHARFMAPRAPRASRLIVSMNVYYGSICSIFTVTSAARGESEGA